MTREINHDASGLQIANSKRTTKSEPNPRPDPESDEANEELPAVMQEYSDKWYRPDS